MTKRFLNKNERRFERGILGTLTLLPHQGCLRDYQRTGGGEAKHLPQAQEEEEGDEQSDHGDAVTQEVDDDGDLVVHLSFFLQGEKEETREESVGISDLLRMRKHLKG